MGEGFVKLKKKFMLSAILKSVLFGVAAGLFVVGVVLLALKMSSNAIHVAWYILMGIGTALLVGGTIFFVLLPTNKRLGRRLDSEYSLNERVQTSLQFAGKPGTVVEMQREDADTRLKALRLHKPGVLKIIATCLAAVLAIGVAATGIFIPAEVAEGIIPQPPRPEDAPFALTDLQIERLEELILEVRGSHLEEGRKDPAADEIKTMLEDLKAIDKEGAMTKRVNEALVSVQQSIEGQISYKKIAEGLSIAGQSQLVQSVYNGVEVYIGETFSQIEHVDTDFYTNRFDLIDVELSAESALLGLRTSLRNAETGLSTTLTNTAAQIRLALTNAKKNVSEDDALYAVIADFVTTLGALAETLGDSIGEDVEKTNAFDAAFDNFTYLFTQAVAEQSYRLAMNLYVGNQIRAVFGMTLLQPRRSSASGGGEEGKPLPGGGFGPGDVKYGSNDVVYDPDTGKYVTYGELLTRYYAIVQELLRSGELTEEQQTALKAFFDSLYKQQEEDKN